MRYALSILLLFVAGAAHANDLAPGGTLRAAFIATNPVQGTVDPATGRVSGPAADLGAELARRNGVGFTITGLPSPQAIIDALKAGTLDIGFIASDPARAAEVDFSSPWALAHNSYLVRMDSPARSVTDIDQPGRRIGVRARDSADLVLSRTLAHATLQRYPEHDNVRIAAQLASGQLDAYATNRQRLSAIAGQSPDLRVLPDNFLSVTQAVAMPKGAAARKAIIEQFLAAARAEGLIQAALDRAGLVGIEVAPAR
jgi:polar amino acid transport system substrate-binding protein